jgi:dienelactone hydrolase
MRAAFVLLLCTLGRIALSASSVAAEDMVTFEASQPFSAERILLRGELFRPDGPGPFPAVILMHGCGGWQPAVHYALQIHARYLRDHGFVVLNLDSFGPRNISGNKICTSDRDLHEALSYRAHDAFDGLRYLQGLDFVSPENIFLMGQSNGGAVAIRVAKTATVHNAGTTFRGIVAYYPWCGEFGGSRVSLASPLLIFAGGKDDWVPARECQGVKATGSDLRVTIYPEAAHSFDLEIMVQRYLGKLVGSDPDAARDSREKMLAFFTENLTDGVKQQRQADRQRVRTAQATAGASTP